MKKILLRSVTVIQPQSGFNNKTVDVLISDGLLTAIADKITPESDFEVIDGSGKFLSPGFFDLNANFCEPGLETKEDLESGSKASAAGGFTGVAVMPNTNPPVHSKSEVAYIVNKTKNNIVDVYPLGAISFQRDGKDLAELYDMHLAGAIAFTDGDHPVTDSGLMSRALLYSKGFEGLVFSYAEDRSIAGKGKMNEGEVSTYLGIKGIPAMAEEVMIVRDIYLAEYNDSRIHFSTISTAHGVDLVRQAKKRGLKISCDVAAHHLNLTEKSVENFDSNYKVKPPLRTQTDIDALIAGLKDGTVDALVSQHTPHEIEFKDVEFEIASYGIIGSQTALPLAIKAGLSVEEIVEKLAINPRKILNIPIPNIEPGQPANVVLFDTETLWVFNSESNFSKSANTPFINQELKGKVFLISNNNQYLTF